MSKHPLDHDHDASTKRAEVYTKPEHAEGLHPATRALHQRPRGDSTERTARFAKIEREEG